MTHIEQRTYAIQSGLVIGAKVIYMERAVEEAKAIPHSAVVVAVNPHIFVCRTQKGLMRCFRYNQLVGNEGELDRVKLTKTKGGKNNDR